MTPFTQDIRAKQARLELEHSFSIVSRVLQEQEDLLNSRAGLEETQLAQICAGERTIVLHLADIFNATMPGASKTRVENRLEDFFKDTLSSMSQNSHRVAPEVTRAFTKERLPVNKIIPIASAAVKFGDRLGGLSLIQQQRSFVKVLQDLYLPSLT